jgi:hypothetical protein
MASEETPLEDPPKLLQMDSPKPKPARQNPNTRPGPEALDLLDMALFAHPKANKHKGDKHGKSLVKRRRHHDKVAAAKAVKAANAMLSG